MELLSYPPLELLEGTMGAFTAPVLVSAWLHIRSRLAVPKLGHTSVKVYERKGDNAFVLSIEPSPAGYGAVDHTSGIAVTNQPTIPEFPQGVLAINDQINANEDFKLYSWADIAKAGHLIVDTTWSPRPSQSKRD
jgi:hypothetical protein